MHQKRTSIAGVKLICMLSNAVKNTCTEMQEWHAGENKYENDSKSPKADLACVRCCLKLAKKFGETECREAA